METYGLMVGTDYSDLSEDLQQELEALAQASQALLEHALELSARVVVVTNASDGWIEASCEAWLPGLRPILEKVERTSARSRWEPTGVESPTGWKAREFKTVIDCFYSRYENQTWKNIVTIGDAPYEHEALRRVVDDAPQRLVRKCRSKSVYFRTKPSISELTYQLNVVKQTLKTVVQSGHNLELHVPMEFLQQV